MWNSFQNGFIKYNEKARENLKYWNIEFFLKSLKFKEIKFKMIHSSKSPQNKMGGEVLYVKQDRHGATCIES